MLPDRKEAESFLRESEEIHPGPWADHCRTAAECAEKIARNCSGLDPEKHTSSDYSMISEEGLKREPILNIS